MIDAEWVEATRAILAKQGDYHRAADDCVASSHTSIIDCHRVLRETEHLIKAENWPLVTAVRKGRA